MEARILTHPHALLAKARYRFDAFTVASAGARRINDTAVGQGSMSSAGTMAANGDARHGAGHRDLPWGTATR